MERTNAVCLRCFFRSIYPHKLKIPPSPRNYQQSGKNVRDQHTPRGVHTDVRQSRSYHATRCVSRVGNSEYKWSVSRYSPPEPAQFSKRRDYATTGKIANPSSKLSRLDHRRLLAVHGQDAAHFLQGLTTNNVPFEPEVVGLNGTYSAFLNAQGRLLHDVFIYPSTTWNYYREKILPESTKNKKGAHDPGFLIEVDADGQQSLVKHLKRYKLRAKVDVWALDAQELNIIARYGAQSTCTQVQTLSLECEDNRSPGFGSRILSPDDSVAVLNGQDYAPLSLYNRVRHMAGIPEGQAATGEEMPYAASLPHETNIDLMGGVDFRKGCYVGQELTIRTQHKGVVRKRILPVSLYSNTGGTQLVEQIQQWIRSGAVVDIIAKGRRSRPAGRWVAGVPSSELGVVERAMELGGEVGIAMCRLEMMTDLVVEAGGDGGGVRYKEGDEFVLRPKWDDGKKGSDAPEICVKAHVPQWIRDGIESRTRKGGNDRAVDSMGIKEEAVAEG